MKRKLQAWAALSRRTAARAQTGLRWAMLTPLAALSAAPAWAAGLPTVTPPTTGAGGTPCNSGDMTCYIGGYVSLGLQALAIIIAAAFLIYYAIGVFTRWKSYSDGREEMGHVISFAVIGGVLAGIIVLAAWQATQYLGAAS